MSNGWRVAVVGATGVCGETLLKVLGSREFAVDRLDAVASGASIGRTVEFRHEEQGITALENYDFRSVDFALFAVPADVALAHAPRAAEAGAVVVDASAAFAGDDSVPMVAMAFDADAAGDYADRRILRSPAGAALSLARVLRPVANGPGLSAAHIAGYLAVAGAGRAAIDELAAQCTQLLNGRPVPTAGPAFAARIAFNCIPTVGLVGDDGRTEAERWIVDDLAHLIGVPATAIHFSAVHVPAFYGDGFALDLATRAAAPAEVLAGLFAASPGLSLPGGSAPTPAGDAAEQDEVLIGRLRSAAGGGQRDHSLWIAADNLRQSALNTVTLVEVLARDHF
jgi:aspartate-semialdehyde dehydrogenase